MAVLGALAAGAGAAHAQQGVEQRIRENQNRLESIRRERSRLEDELERLRRRAHTLEAELTNLERQRTVTNRMVNELDRQMRQLRDQLDTVTLDLIVTHNAHAEKQAVLKRRLVEIYKRGPLWTARALLSAGSFGDLLSRYKYLFLVSRQDRALVSEVEDLEARVARQRQQLLIIERELQQRLSERSRELDRYTELGRLRERSLRQARTSEQRAALRLDSLARAERDLTDLLANLERERRRALAARGDAGGGAATISERSVGTLDWPVEGELAYTFGRQQGPDRSSVYRTGIGIRVPVGTPVRAVAGGLVRVARHMDTWGLTVILEHGGGFYTVYMHLSALSVAEGQSVTAGHEIGLSGGEGTEHGPHVEFQIRQGRDGNPVALDPLNWLKRRR